MDKEQATRIQLAANAVEACDYWAKASAQTLELHRLARQHGTTAGELLRKDVKLLIRGQDADRCVDLITDVRILCSATAGALLRPPHASSRLQPAEHRATGEHLVENEPKLAATIIPALNDKRAQAIKTNKPAHYADFIIAAATACSPVLNTLSAARAGKAPESASETSKRLRDDARAYAPGIESAAGVLATGTNANVEKARLFERSALPLYIALESASHILDAEFARLRDDLDKREQELASAQAAERASRNQRTLSAIAAAGEAQGGFKDGLRDVLGIRKQVAEQA